MIMSYGLVFDRNRIFTETLNAETDHFKKPKFGRNRIFCRNSLISADTVLFLPIQSHFCRNSLISAKTVLFLQKHLWSWRNWATRRWPTTVWTDREWYWQIWTHFGKCKHILGTLYLVSTISTEKIVCLDCQNQKWRLLWAKCLFFLQINPISAKTSLFLPKNVCFCQNIAVSAEIVMFLLKWSCFCISAEIAFCRINCFCRICRRIFGRNILQKHYPV